jgi:hypothetical protein
VSLIAPGGQHEERGEGNDDLWSLGLSNQRQLCRQDGEYYVPRHPGVRVQVKVGSPHKGEYPVSAYLVKGDLRFWTRCLLGYCFPVVSFLTLF